MAKNQYQIALINGGTIDFKAKVGKSGSKTGVRKLWVERSPEKTTAETKIARHTVSLHLGKESPLVRVCERDVVTIVEIFEQREKKGWKVSMRRIDERCALIRELSVTYDNLGRILNEAVASALERACPAQRKERLVRGRGRNK